MRWRQIRNIFDGALERAPDERPRFLDEVCANDQEVRREVESLLSSLDSAENFMETPAVAKVADVIEAEQKKLETGKRFGHYEIIEQIGAGGMGEVFLAKDAELERFAALKMLPFEVSMDAERIRRFVQEAKAASALNHPNILTIYEIGAENGLRFIASEFIAGETLRQKFDARKFSAGETLEIAVQIAAALDAAHRNGIVHRDIKPENVMIREDGLVKVLDFGIAKLTEKRPEMFDAEAAPAIKAESTNPGVIIGTANYMSPEQARGKAVDARSDIFSFGIVLYEMLSGKRAFAGETAMDTIGAILHKEPVPLSELMPDTPAEIERILTKTLKKDRDERYQTAKDLLIDLKNLQKRLEFEAELLQEGEKGRRGERESDAVSLKISSSPFLPFSPSRLPPNNLTPSLSPIIGREKEIAEIRNLLSQNSVRILTMTGIGGTGKTTLAQAVAQEALANFKGGVFFVELAAVTNPELVASTIAQTLDVKEGGGKPILEILENYLRGRQMLLVLDNFEQVLTAAPVLTKLVQAAPDLKILVTSRARLHLSSDCEFVVPPLAVPESTARISLEELSEYESVKLFVERARAVKPNFALREENAGSVAEICLRLDGLPLAIELAAARVRIITPASILEKLENHLKLLTGGAKDLPARQQTVRGMVEWSYELLETDEKTLFRRLAVFAGGFTFEAAEAIVEGEKRRKGEKEKFEMDSTVSPSPLLPISLSVLDGITSLLDGSLLVQKEQADGESRFRMLEVVREYALEVLETSNESENMRRNHAGYFLALGEEAEPHLLGERAIEWLEKIDREYDNLRAALRWAIENDHETGLRLSGALWTFWSIRGHLREAREQLEKSLTADCADERATTARWKSLNGAGYIACQQGDYPAAQKFIEQSLQIAEATGERRQIALSSRQLGFVVNLQGDATQARRFYEKSLRLGKELSDEKVVALSLAALADLARAAGDYQAAQQLYEKTFRSFQAINNRDGMSATLCNLGAVAFALGDFAAARASYAQAVEAALKLKNKVYVSWALDGFAALAASENDCESAARLAGAIENLRDSIGYELEAADRSFRDAYLTKTRHALGDARFARAYEAGQAIDLDEAIVLAALDEKVFAE